MRVILPCYILNQHLLDLTTQCIDSLGDNIELIIIDNGSPMGGGYLREKADIYIRNKTNLGYAKAVNQGLKLCNPREIVAIVNNDTWVSNDWQKIVMDILQDSYNIGSVHFRMIPYTQEFNPGDDTWESGKERWCTSSFFVVRNVQLYDENFLNSYDDWSFWYEMRMKGYTTAYTNRVEYRHMDSSTQVLNPIRVEQDKKNMEYYVKKYGMTAEEQFERMFPGELVKPWTPQP